MKRTILATLFAASLGAISMPAGAAASIYVQVAPPAPRYEVVPAERHGYTWVPGYWDYRGTRHYWVSGHYVRNRHGYRYESSRWVEHDGGWRLERGRWARGDNDRDGVPNYADRSPNNPYRQ